jgi:type I restriction enzyme S subunit
VVLHTLCNISTDNHYYEKFEDGTINDITDEIPFDIPDNWIFMRLYSVANVYTGNSISETEKTKKYTNLSGGFNFIATKDVSFENTIDYSNGIKIPFNETKFKIAPAFSTLMCVEGGSVGRKIGYLNEDVCFGNKLASINSYCINKKYIYYLFQSQYIRDFIKENMTGIIGGISINKLKQFIVPIPTLNEQIRIINKLENILPKINAYNKTYIQLNTLNDSYKEDLKKSILQYAIQGKLVKQNPNDESADKLIERILEEKRQLMKDKKIKKENLSIIYKDTDNQFYEKFDDGTINNITDEIPFEIPQNWCWTRLRNIGTLQTGTTPTTARKDYFGRDVPFIKPGDIFYNKIIYDNEGLTFEGAEHSRMVDKESILMVCIGGSIGKAYFVDRKVCFNQQINAITPLTLDYKYLYYIMISEYFFKFLKNNSGGTATPIINKSLWGELLIPIAPINEQNKISNKINNIINYIETAE